jgi:hypothetical protein
VDADGNTYWESTVPPQSATQSFWVDLQPASRIGQVYATAHFSEAASGNITVRLTSANLTPIVIDRLVFSASSSMNFQPLTPVAFQTPVPNIRRIEVIYSDFSSAVLVGLSNIEALNYSPPSSASFFRPLERLLSFLALRPAYAAPLDQAPPPAGIDPALPTPTPIRPPVQVKPSGIATPVVIGAPQIPNTTLPVVPGAPPGQLSQPAAIQSQQVPSGRVAFTIVGQVRPGGS